MNLEKELLALTDGLLYPSETDSPFVVKIVPSKSELNVDDIGGHIGINPVESVEEVSLAHFFRNLSEEKDWHDDGMKALVPRYQKLMSFLTDTFDKVTVYRFGNISIEAVIYGIKDQHHAIIKTTVVET